MRSSLASCCTIGTRCSARTRCASLGDGEAALASVSRSACEPSGPPVTYRTPARHEKYDLYVIVTYIPQRKFILVPAIFRFLRSPRSDDRHTPRTTKHDALRAVALSQLVKKRHYRLGMTVAPYRKARLRRSAFVAYYAQCSVLRSVPGALKTCAHSLPLIGRRKEGKRRARCWRDPTPLTHPHSLLLRTLCLQVVPSR